MTSKEVSFKPENYVLRKRSIRICLKEIDVLNGRAADEAAHAHNSNNNHKDNHNNNSISTQYYYQYSMIYIYIYIYLYTYTYLFIYIYILFLCFKQLGGRRSGPRACQRILQDFAEIFQDFETCLKKQREKET